VAEPTKSEEKDLPTLVSELWELVVRYAKQETLDPAKALLRYLKWGVPGAVLLAVGVPLLLLGGLRAAEEELSPHLSGNLSWVPYAMVVVVSGALIGVLVSRIGADKRRAERQRAALRKREG
jgi:hypothetical protein